MHPNKFAKWHCIVRRVSHDNLKIDIEGNLSRPLHKIKTHTVFYYKYNTYQKFAIDLREDMCKWLAKKDKSYLLDWTLKKVQQYSNVNHPCPYNETIYVKNNNLSISNIPFEPLLPSGRYRIDINLTDQFDETIFSGKLFGSVSDHRIEQI